MPSLLVFINRREKQKPQRKNVKFNLLHQPTLSIVGKSISFLKSHDHSEKATNNKRETHTKNTHYYQTIVLFYVQVFRFAQNLNIAASHHSIDNNSLYKYKYKQHFSLLYRYLLLLLFFFFYKYL